MRITGEVTDALQEALADGQSALARDLRRGMEAAATAVQADLRGQTRAAGLGAGLEKAWQKQVYPRSAGGKSLNPAALVYGKSRTLFTVFSEGATIIPKKGRFLAIPTKEAEALGFAETRTTRTGGGSGAIPRRSSMVALAVQRLGEKNVRVVPAKGGRMLMLYRVPAGRGEGRAFRGPRGTSVGFRRGADVPIFVLVPSVRLKARLDLNAARTRANATLASEIGAALAAG